MRVRRILSAAVAVVWLSSLAPAAASAADEVILDDSAGSVQITGPWLATSTSPGFFGEGYRFRVAGDGANSVRWPFPSAAVAGSYELFARWTSGENRASNATYLVTHAGGSTSVAVDQRINGAVWKSLGTFNFAPGGEQGVTLTDRADGVVVADAVRWVPSTSSATQP